MKLSELLHRLKVCFSEPLPALDESDSLVRGFVSMMTAAQFERYEQLVERKRGAAMTRAEWRTFAQECFEEVCAEEENHDMQ